MRGPRGRAAVAGAALAAAVAALLAGGPASGETIGSGTWELEVEGEVKPRTLPRNPPAPVRLRLGAEVRGLDGQPGPSLKRMVFDLDRSMRLNTRGLPRCHPSKLRDSRSGRAERVCAGALVGRGRIEALIRPVGQAPLRVRGPMLAFNGPRRRGTATLAFHVFARVPAPTVFVSTAKVRRAPGGRFGRRLRIDVPRYGADSRITSARLRFHKRWRARGRTHSYVRASCRQRRLIGVVRLSFIDADDVKAGFARPCRVSS